MPWEIDQLYKLNPEHSCPDLEFTTPCAEDIFKHGGRKMSDSFMSNVPASSPTCLPSLVHIRTVPVRFNLFKPCTWMQLEKIARLILTYIIIKLFLRCDLWIHVIQYSWTNWQIGQNKPSMRFFVQSEL